MSFYIRKFLYRQLHPESDAQTLPQYFLPTLDFRIDVFHSATAIFYAPSDLSGIGGMKREIIRSTPEWRGKGARYDTVFVETDPGKCGMRGLHVARVFLFFRFTLDDVSYPCAIIQWYEFTDDVPDEDTGLWVVKPGYLNDEQYIRVIHIESIIRAAHLIPVFGDKMVPEAHELNSGETLDNYMLFYVNKYVDYHAHELAF